MGVMALFKLAGLRLTTQSLALIVPLAAMIVLHWVIGKTGWAFAEALRSAIYGITIFAVLVLAGAAASYPIAALTTHYYDADLEAIDNLLHFDWRAIYTIVAGHTSLQHAGVAAYRSIYLTPAILLCHWAVTDQPTRAHRFLFEFWCSAALTLALFALMPAAGPLSYLWHGLIPYMPDSELCQPQLISALRLERVRAIDLTNLCGLVSAPSFHAVAFVLYCRSAVTCGPLKWPIIALSSAMFVATPVEGTHYLIDVVLGVAVATCVLWGIGLVARRYAPGLNPGN